MFDVRCQQPTGSASNGWVQEHDGRVSQHGERNIECCGRDRQPKRAPIIGNRSTQTRLKRWWGRSTACPTIASAARDRRLAALACNYAPQSRVNQAIPLTTKCHQFLLGSSETSERMLSLDRRLFCDIHLSGWMSIYSKQGAEPCAGDLAVMFHGSSTVLLFSKLNKIFFRYFDPENIFLVNENN